jgi:hypothetical protein
MSGLQQSIDDFLHDDSVGTGTGISKILADLGCWRQAFKFPKDVGLKVLAGCASFHYISDEHEKANEIIDYLSRQLPGVDVKLMIVNAVSKPTERARFTRLLYDREWVEDYERQLLVDLDSQLDYIDARPKLDWTLPEMQELGRNHYTTLRRLVGIGLSTGDVSKAQGYMKRIKALPGREHYGEHGHTEAVGKYLEKGGTQYLINRSAFKAGVNKYWWKTRVGTARHPGRYYCYFKPVLDAMIRTPFTTLTQRATQATIIAGGAWLAVTYGPTVMDTIKAMPHMAMECVTAIQEDPSLLLYPTTGIGLSSVAIYTKRSHQRKQDPPDPVDE